MTEHWFWWLLTMACIGWYSTITVYVAIKGAADIRQMLARLSAYPAHTSGRGESANHRATEPQSHGEKE